jgi:hypothetical protein
MAGGHQRFDFVRAIVGPGFPGDFHARSIRAGSAAVPAELPTSRATAQSS